jgi:hypothetical protein
MKVFVKTVIYFLLITFFSCEKATLFESRCSNCFTSEPIEADVEILLTPYSNSNYKTTVIIYEGHLEDSIVLQQFETLSSSWIHKMGINKMYTCVAKYYQYGTFYEAINSVTPEVKYEKFLCANPCYRVIDNKCDLRIKYH